MNQFSYNDQPNAELITDSRKAAVSGDFSSYNMFQMAI
jgi:hypothetical protein